jgi:hypothetical protein
LVAKNEEMVNLREHGIRAGDIQFGINMPLLESQGGYGLDNNANPYFVYRAFMVDNVHNKKNEVGVYKCNFQQKNAAYEQNLVDDTEENREKFNEYADDHSEEGVANGNTLEEYQESNRVSQERWYKQTYCIDNYYE